jgi:hypothetical protein
MVERIQTMKTKKKILIHKHKFGTSVATFTCDFDTDQLSEDEAIKLAKICELDFEPEEGEELEIVDFDEATCPSVTKDMLL